MEDIMLQSDVLEQHGFKPWQHEIGTDYPWEKKLTAKHNFTEKVYSVLTEILLSSLVSFRKENYIF